MRCRCRCRCRHRLGSYYGLLTVSCFIQPASCLVQVEVRKEAAREHRYVPPAHLTMVRTPSVEFYILAMSWIAVQSFS